MPFGYPVMLELSGRRCVVIGADAVREGKVEALLAAGADDVLVVAPGPERRLRDVEAVHGVIVERRDWRADDLNGAFVAVAGSRDAGERDAIAREARARRVLVNVMDDIPNCDWSAPSVVRRGELVLAIATGGASPALAKKLRVQLAAEFGEEWSEVSAVLREVRRQTSPLLPDLSIRARRWGEALDLDEAVSLVKQGRGDELADRLRARLQIDEHATSTSVERDTHASEHTG
jgi:precorrin-2 dehydrogenase/sirohydrochlorin ferrochelatase